MKIYTVVPYYSDCEGTDIHFTEIKSFINIEVAKKYISELGSCDYEIVENELDMFDF
jgi:hypothetical protein